MTTVLTNVQGKGPVSKAESGKFQVSIWHWKKTITPSDGDRDYSPEREIDIQRACIRFCQWNRGTRTWEEKLIWCNTDDLRSLVQALDGINIEE